MSPVQIRPGFHPRAPYGPSLTTALIAGLLMAAIAAATFCLIGAAA